jgi:CDP-glycerol glycerophosphotransferase (TagB/SpsB family)
VLARHGEDVIRDCVASGAHVIVKLHACSYHPDPALSGGVDWSGRMGALARELKFSHLPGASLAILMLAADAMIADFGSAPVEFCLLDRPLIFFRSDAQAVRTGGDGFQYAQLCAAGGGVSDRRELRQALEKILAGADGRATARRAVRDEFFHEPGHATERCLRELYDMMELHCPAELCERYREQRGRDLFSTGPMEE